MARTAHHVGHEIEALKALRVHQQHPVARGPEVDLAFARGGFHFHAVAGHEPGKAAGGVVLMHPALGMRRVFLNVDAVFAHLLEAADVSGGKLLPGDERGTLFLARDDLRHVVQGVLADRLLDRDRDGSGHTGLLRQGEAWAVLIRGLSLAGAADPAVGGGVVGAAERAAGDRPERTVPEHVLTDADLAEREDRLARFLDLGLQPFGILLLLGALLEEPAADGVVGLQLVVVELDAEAFSGSFVVQGHRVNAEGQDAEPAVAERARRKQLHGVGKAVGRFTDGVVQDAFRHVALGKLHHVAADDQAGSGIPVKGTGLFHEFFMRPGADGHGHLAGLGRYCSSGRSGAS